MHCFLSLSLLYNVFTKLGASWEHSWQKKSLFFSVPPSVVQEASGHLQTFPAPLPGTINYLQCSGWPPKSSWALRSTSEKQSRHHLPTKTGKSLKLTKIFKTLKISKPGGFQGISQGSRDRSGSYSTVSKYPSVLPNCKVSAPPGHWWRR